MATKNGGPAFPYSSLAPEGPTVYKDNEGMSLRDWFAGQGLAGVLVHEQAFLSPERVAEWAYQYADAMLAERAK